jgi:predicted DNA-binding antitoxin AbrB/MazE fold protein
MVRTVEAVFENGLLRPLRQLALSEGEKISIILIGPEGAKTAAMRDAMNDPLFLADLRERANVFIQMKRSCRVAHPL